MEDKIIEKVLKNAGADLTNKEKVAKECKWIRCHESDITKRSIMLYFQTRPILLIRESETFKFPELTITTVYERPLI